MTPAHYFAYGSNMNPARVVDRGIRFTQISAAVLVGYVLSFNKCSREQKGAGHANIVIQLDGCVEGVLYQLESANEIEKMDVFEHVPTNYSRDVVRVKTQADELPAWTYFANPKVVLSGLKPPCWYLAHLLRGRPYLSDRYHEMLESIECVP
ncbi:MAG: gamma-glutamylcyclotransferase family protein [Pseudomonadota bacterium]|nr:gamma-glutamylcyclotransferase family protein [Pseudomonadota bacterium]